MTDWQPIEAYASCAAVLVTAKNEYGAFRTAISAFKDATGVWRLLGSQGGNAKLRFKPTHFTAIPTPPEPDMGNAA